MITYSIIKKSQLEGALRLDAEYYQPEYLEVKKIFTNAKVDKISDLTSFVKKGIFDLSPDNYIADGIPFMRVQNIKTGFLNEENLVFISPEVHKKELKTELRSLDIVFSKVGTVGEISIIPSHFVKANFSQNVIGIKINDNIPKGYLLLFLLSKFGQFQIMRANMQQVQAKLELKDIRDLKVIRLGNEENEFHKKLLETEHLFEDSKFFYSQAEILLLEELGLKNFESESGLWSVVHLSEAKKANRIDPDFFDPKYTKLFKILEKNSMRLGDLANRITKRVDLQTTQEYNYIEISDINVGCGEASSNKIVGKDLPANAKIKISGGEIIISKVRPTRGAIAIIPKDWSKDFVASGAFSVFGLESPMRECLQVILKSFIGKLQLEKPTTGTSYPTVTDKDVENILIPILSKATQQKIAELVQKSHESRKKAKELLESAKHKVEELIEKGSAN